MSESLFEKTVKTENSFLAGGFNFKLVSSTERHVRYESNEVYVEYYFENGRGYEIDFWIGKLDSERSYSSDQIQDFFNSNITEVLGKSATTDELVRKIVSHLSTILKKDAPKLLTGDKEIFNELQKFNQQKILEYSIETNLRQARNNDYKPLPQPEFPRPLRPRGAGED